MKTWHNATTEQQIATLQANIASLSERYLVSVANYTKCKNAGLLYNCNKNTGKTQSSWYETMKDQEALMRKYEAELARLTGIQQSTAETLKAKAAADLAVSQASAAGSQAISSQASAIGKWIFIGIGALGLMAVIYFKVIRKNK
jgi:hypothetical protein